MAKDIKRVVLAYSGGLDTSIILKWLQTTYGCEVVTFTADLGLAAALVVMAVVMCQTGGRQRRPEGERRQRRQRRDDQTAARRAQTGSGGFAGGHQAGTIAARP